jgi:hypothetical protein
MHALLLKFLFEKYCCTIFILYYLRKIEEKDRSMKKKGHQRPGLGERGGSSDRRCTATDAVMRGDLSAQRHGMDLTSWMEPACLLSCGTVPPWLGGIHALASLDIGIKIGRK